MATQVDASANIDKAMELASVRFSLDNRHAAIFPRHTTMCENPIFDSQTIALLTKGLSVTNADVYV